jgi:hypothetical protein
MWTVPSAGSWTGGRGGRKSIGVPEDTIALEGSAAPGVGFTRSMI